MYIYLLCMKCRLTNLGGVVCSAENQLGGSVVSRAYVRHVGFIFDQNLSTAKIAELQNTSAWIQQQVLRLDITMANSLRMDIGEGAEQLVDIQLDLEYGHGGLHLVEIP